MYITLHTDYALRILIYLGANPGRVVTIAEISERFAVSRSHLMKVVSQLVREGLVEGLRGKGGGLRLAQPAERIAVGEVVRRMEKGWELAECFSDHSHCLLDPGCRLKHTLAKALDAFFASLDQTSLADLIGPGQAKLLQALRRIG